MTDITKILKTYGVHLILLQNKGDMNIEQARKILGKFSKNKTDNDIQEVIDILNKIIEVGFEKFELDHGKISLTNRQRN